MQTPQLKLNMWLHPKLQKKLYGSTSSYKFLQDLEVVHVVTAPLKLFCDNSGVVAQFNEPMNHKNQKHIERKYHLIRDIVQRGDVEVTQIVA